MERVKAGRRLLRKRIIGTDARLLTSVRNSVPRPSQRPGRSAGRFERIGCVRETGSLTNSLFCGIVYESETMHTLVITATHFAMLTFQVLITGPNCAGKEGPRPTLSKHSSSVRRRSPISKSTLGALPRTTLLEAELSHGDRVHSRRGARGAAQQAGFEAASDWRHFVPG